MSMPIEWPFILGCPNLLKVVTSDIKGAGTDADVYVELQGKNGNTGRIFLPSKLEDFERGSRWIV